MTLVQTYSWAPAGLPSPIAAYGTSVDWSAWSNAQRDAYIEGLQKWSDHCDIIFIEIPDSGAPNAADSHSPRHLRLFTGPNGGSTVATAGSFDAWTGDPNLPNLGNDAYTWHDSLDADEPFMHLSNCRNLGMHEAGHNIIGTPHKSGSTVMNPSLNGSTYADTQQRQAASDRYGSPKSMAVLYDGPIGQISNLFFGLLVRQPDGEGLKYYNDQMENGGLSATLLAGQIMAGGEYQGGGWTVNQFVSNLYLNMLGRIPSAGEKQFYVDAINNGQKTRAQVAAEFADSNEGVNVLLSKHPNGFWRP